MDRDLWRAGEHRGIYENDNHDERRIEWVTSVVLFHSHIELNAILFDFVDQPFDEIRLICSYRHARTTVDSSSDELQFKRGVLPNG